MPCRKYIIHISLLICLFILANHTKIAAQRDTLSGLWEGVLTIEKDGVIAANYDVFFNFNEENDVITGTSTIVYNNMSAKISFRATQKNTKSLEIQEIEILKADVLPNGEWCVKNISLKRFFEKNEVIWRGEWIGKTSFSDCPSGKIYLKKAVKRV